MGVFVSCRQNDSQGNGEGRYCKMTNTLFIGLRKILGDDYRMTAITVQRQ